MGKTQLIINAAIVRDIQLGSEWYDRTLVDKLDSMAGLWEEEAEWIDGYNAAVHELMGYIGISHDTPDATSGYCPHCHRNVWRLDRYCAHCGKELPEVETSGY